MTKKFRVAKRRTDGVLRYTVYLIKTKTPNFYYVGWARNHMNRWNQHRNGTGAQFTKKHGVQEATILCRVDDWKEAEWREKLYTILLKRDNPTWVVSMGLPIKTFQIAYTLLRFGYLAHSSNREETTEG
jgi:predicted GIY-YIG superfamily endonuclease